MRLRYRVTESFLIPPKDQTITAIYYVFATSMVEAVVEASKSFAKSCQSVTLTVAEDGTALETPPCGSSTSD